ncbi:MAG: arginine--tRNA ligase [Actinobacteria bacterium]|nr:arginine--tRNA ligase [Actinomycetota bacterium]
MGPEQLAPVVRDALDRAGLPDRAPTFERPRQREHGDWSTNVALTLAKPVGRSPRDIAQAIIDHLGTVDGVHEIDVAGPGFINFHVARDALGDVVRQIVTAGAEWGRSQRASGAVNVEFVSANPTGPLHMGHGRQAAVGDALANLLEAVGWDVTREYYFNDAGRQMRLFSDSVTAVSRGEEPPEDGYHGAYISDVVDEIERDGGTDDLGEAAYERILGRITGTLDAMRVHFDVFFGERALHPDGVAKALAALGDHVYTADGATWLRTTSFGDDKDRVLIRSDGEPTYFAADCAYMADKFSRGFDRLIYVLGSDHHGYIKRLEAIADAFGYDRDRIEIVMHQFVNLFRGGAPVRMSKRTGEMVTFDELLEEVGTDAARYTFLRYSRDVPIDFDLEAVVQADRANPVYYVQYSSARIAGIMRTAHEAGLQPSNIDDADLALLDTDAEQELIRVLSTYPEVVALAADERAPQRIARYAERLAEHFHRFYTECQVVGDDRDLSTARYWLVVAARQTLVNALGLLGVTAPERM